MLSPAKRSPRRGLSLMEVLVALAIFLFALIVISRLVILGSDRAIDVQQQGQAVQLCQAKLAEVIAGAVTLSSQEEIPFDEDPAWGWSLDCAEEGNVPGLWNVHVRVSRLRPDGTTVECALSQMVLDPSLRGSTMDAALAAAATTDTGLTDSSDQGTSSSSSSSGSNTSSSGSTPSSSGGGGGTAATSSGGGVGSVPSSGGSGGAPGGSSPPSTGSSKSGSTRGGR